MKSSLYSISLVALVISTGWTDAAVAQEATTEERADSGLQDIVVTAQRREESAQKTPVAITAIGGDSLQSAGVFETSDIAQAVPNLQIAAPFGKAQPNFAMRGISIANEYNANTASPIGVYVDDAYLSSRSSHGAQLYDLERVEVLRGPQGTLYGRNTTAGAINFITRRPDLDENGGYLEAGYGNKDRVSAQGALNLVAVPGQLAFRAAADYVHSDGYVKNIFPGQPDAQSEDSFSARLSMLWQPDDSFTLFLKGYYARSNPLAGAVHGEGIGVNGVNPLSGYSRDDLGFYEINGFHIGHYKTDTKGVLLSLSKEFDNGVTLSSITSYDKGYRRNDQEGTHSPFDMLDVFYRDDFEQVNQEVRVNYQGDRVKAILGGYYGWDRVDVFNTFTFFQFLRDTVPFNFPNSGFGVDAKFSQTRRSKAIFGQVDYELTDQLTATLGLRYTWDTLRYFRGNANILDYDGNPVLNAVGDPADSFDPVNAPGIGPYDPNSFLTRSLKNSALSGRFGLNYQFSNDVMAYASYSRGYRAGAVNGGGYLGNDLVTLVEPEKVDAFEVGVKSELLDRHLRLNFAGFYYKYKNQQLQEVLGAVAVLRNAPKSTLYGLEVEATARLADNLTAEASLGLLHTEYDGLVLSGVDLDGNRLPFAPKVSFNGSLDWTVVDFGTGTVSLRPNVSYVGQQWFTPANGKASTVTDTIGNGKLQQKAYWLVGGNIGLEMESGFYASIWAKNLFDKGYYVYGLDLRSSFGYDYLAVGAPRSFGVTVGHKF